MRPLKIILTACGCPGASTLIRMLKHNGERNITIIGTDMDQEAIGAHLTDKFYQVPPGDSKDYIPSMLEIVEKEQPDLLFPQSTFEVQPLAQHKHKFLDQGTPVLVSDPKAIKIANNKYSMYETLKKQTDLELPHYKLVTTLDEFNTALEELQYPKKPVIFKPPIGKGSRGVRILDPTISQKQILLEKKPNSKYMSHKEFNSIFQEEKDFPTLLLSEFIAGQEKTTDSICLQGKEILTTIKTVEQARWGVIVRGELIHEENLIDQTQQILKAIPLSYCVNIQFIEDKLIEINPRVSSFIYQKDLNAPYLSIKLALGEITPEELKEYKNKIDYGRRMIRYMDQIFHKNNKKVL